MTVNSTSDLNQRVGNQSLLHRKPVDVPFSSTRNRITPGVQFLIHANIKASFEYQFRRSDPS